MSFKSPKLSLMLHQGNVKFYKSLEEAPERYYAVLQGRTMLCFTTQEHAKAGQVQFAVALDKVDGVMKVWKSPKVENDLCIIWLRSSANTTINFGFQAERSHDQELWHRYLYLSCLLKIPDDWSTLLPGQLRELKSICNRLSSIPSEAPSDSSNAYVVMGPACYPSTSRRSHHNSPTGTSPKPVHNKRHQSLPMVLGTKTANPRGVSSDPNLVAMKSLPSCMNVHVKSREESERILIDQSQQGNLLIRRRSSADHYNFAVSVREPSGKYRHFKLRKHSNGRFSIFLDEEHPPLHSWNDVIKLFVERGRGRYIPINFTPMYDDVTDHTYETSLELREEQRMRRREEYADDGGDDKPFNSMC